MLTSEEFGSPQDEINSHNLQYNIMAVRTRYTNGVKEIRKFMAKNIVTIDGNKFYAQQAANESPSNNFDSAEARVILQNPTGEDSVENTDNFSDVSNPLQLSNNFIQVSFPATDNSDVNNVQISPETSITRKYIWGTGDFNTEGQVETITAGGTPTGYAELIATPSAAGSGVTAVLVATSNASGVIDNVHIINPGSDYTAGTIIITGVDAGTGHTINYGVDANGRIISIDIVSGGSLNDSPIVTIASAGNDDAFAVAQSNTAGTLLTYFIINGGTGYTGVAPTVSALNAVTVASGGTATVTQSTTNDITGGAIHNSGISPSGTDVLLTHFNFASSFEKLSTDELTVYINHQFLGVA